MGSELRGTIDTSDPGKAANVVARAAILFARVCGFNALNEQRRRRDEAVAYLDVAYVQAVCDCFPELKETPNGR